MRVWDLAIDISGENENIKSHGKDPEGTEEHTTNRDIHVCGDTTEHTW